MRIHFKVAVKNIAAPPGFPPDVMRGIGRDLAKGIRDRTRSGRDVRGVPFQRRVDGSPSNLRDSGRMLRSVRARKHWPRGFTIAPSQAVQNLARAHQRGKGGMPVREWFGLSERQINEAAERVRDAYMKRREDR